MNSLSSVKAMIWSVVIVSGLTGSAFASHGHGGGGGHHGGGGHMGGHHGGWSGGGHHHGGWSGGGHHHGGYYGGGYGGYRGYSGFGIGIGGLGYGGYGGYGYGGYPGYGYGYYSTPRYYYSTPTYVTPSYSYPSTVIINSTSSVPAPTFDNGPIVILSPATNDKPIEYMLNGQSFTIKPGQSQKFNHDRDWIVDFDRGNGKGTGKYSLKASTYKFKMSDNGWELFEAAKPEPPTPAADQGEEPKPIDAVKPTEETVKPKATPDAPVPAPDKTDGDAK